MRCLAYLDPHRDLLPVSRASHTSDKLVNLTDVMVGRMQRMRALRSRMDDGLLRLRESILLAREQANNVSRPTAAQTQGCCQHWGILIFTRTFLFFT